MQGLQSTQLRSAGGWVRDKLLGKGSQDINIAVNNMHGEEFARHVNAHLQATGRKVRKVCCTCAGGSLGCRHVMCPAMQLHLVMRLNCVRAAQVAVIKSNPDKCKHLQPARMRVNNVELDLVNLVSGSYPDPCNPESGMGTPEQDALRRDLTVNSLFYNINTEQVRPADAWS